MEWMWWLLPITTGLIGTTLVLTGIGKLFKLENMAATFRLLFGGAFIGLTAVAVMAGLNLQTYDRLMEERTILTVHFTAESEQADTYIAELEFADGSRQTLNVSGDQFMIGAEILTLKPYAILLGHDSLYRLQFFLTLPEFSTASDPKGEDFTGRSYPLSNNPGLDMQKVADEYGEWIGIEGKDTRFGSAVYNPIRHGYSFEILATQTGGLISRPANARTINALALDASQGRG